MVQGQKTDEGYAWDASLGISVQGVDAQDAWRIAYAVAKRLNRPMEISFEWRDKEGAAYPGEVGTLAWQP